MKMKKVLSRKCMALIVSLTMCLPASCGVVVASADNGKVKEFTEDFESYNIQSKVAVYQRSDTTDFTGLAGDNDTPDWKTVAGTLVDMNGGGHYNNFWGDRLISAANPGDDLDTFKTQNSDLYNKIYGNGVYNGNAAAVTITVFNYKGEPVSGNLGGVWYGISKNHDSSAMGAGSSIVKNKYWRDLMVESESSGNQYLQFSTKGSTGKTSSFGRYDLDFKDTVSVLSQRVYIDSDIGTQFDIRFTSDVPTTGDVRTQGDDATFGSKTYKGAGWTFKNVVKDFIDKKSIVTFDNTNCDLLFLGNKVGTYSNKSWYTVDLVIYTKGEKSQIGLSVSDASGNVVCTAPLTDDSFVSTAAGVMYSHIEPESASDFAKLFLDDISLKNVEFDDNFESYNNKAILATTSADDDSYLRVKNILNDNSTRLKDGKPPRYGDFGNGSIVNGANDGDTESLYAADTSENKDKYNAFYGSGVYNANAAANTDAVFNWKGEPVRGQLGSWYGFDSAPKYSCNVTNQNNRNLHAIDENNTNKVMQIIQKGHWGNATVFGKYGLTLVGDYAVLNQKISSRSNVNAKYFGINLTSGNPELKDITVQRNTGSYNTTVDGVNAGGQYINVPNAVTDESFANNQTIVKFADDGKIYFTTNDTYVADYEKNKWYDVKVLMDVKENKIALIIKDENGAVIAATDFVNDSNVTLSGVTGFEYRYPEYTKEEFESKGLSGNPAGIFWLDDVSFTLPSASEFYGDLGIAVDSLAYDADSKKLTSGGKIVSGSAKTAVVIMAVYNKADNSLVGISVKPNTALAAGYNPISFEVELDSYSKDDNSVKYFVWDNMNDLEPIYASVEK